MSRQWGALGAAGAEFNLSDVVDNLVIIAVGGYEPGVPTMHGEKNAVRAALVVLTGDQAGTVVNDMLIFNSRVVSRLKGSVGQTLTVGVAWGQGRGANSPLDLVEVGPQEYAMADAWEQHNPGVLDNLLQQTMAEHHQQMAGGGQQQPQGQQRNQQQYGNQPQNNQRQQWGNAPQQQNTGARQWGGQMQAAPNTVAAAQGRPQQSAPWLNQTTAPQSDEPPF